MKNPFDRNYEPVGPIPVLQQALFAIGFTFIGFVLFQFIGIYMAILATGIPYESFVHPDYVHGGQDLISAMKIFQTMSDIGLFILPAIILPYFLFRKSPVKFMGIDRKPVWILFLIAIALALCIQPLVDLFSRINQWMDLSHLFGVLDHSVNDDIVMKKVLYMPHTSDFIINILFVAVLPALAEELFFRGFLQKTLNNWLKNGHIAVIAAAFIFSFIHLEFTGLLPRWLLGLLMGYAYLWSGDIKIPILIHFTNNFLDLVLNYRLQLEGKMPETLPAESGVPVYIYIASAFMIAILLYLFYIKSRRYAEPSTGEAQHP